ncbi:MAG: response regulator [Elsteraceae bacterium]
MTLGRAKLLVVDDDVELAEMIRDYLQQEGFEVAIGHSADAFRSLVRSADLTILDVILPGASGLDLLRELRARSDAPVILLSARTSEVDRIIGLEQGADDYVAKPFKPRELLARIRAVLRRTAPGPAAIPDPRPSDGWIAVGDLRLDPTSRIAKFGDRTIDITSAEFSLLEQLLRRAGEPISREELAFAAFGRRNGLTIDRNIDTLISKLRRKLASHDGVESRIKTIRKVGYIYAR